MKRMFFILALLCACAGSPGITHEQFSTEQARVDAYLDNQYNGGPFAHAFYATCDTFYAVPGNRHAVLIYANLSLLRSADSLRSVPRAQYLYTKRLLDIQFKAAEGK